MDRSIDNPVEFLNSNVIGTFVLLDETGGIFQIYKKIKKKL